MNSVTRFGIVFLMAILAVLGGCTVYPGANKQGYAGITVVDIDLQAQTVSVHDGKEKSNVKWDGKIATDGTVEISYDASDVKAFPAIAVRGEVEKVLAEQQVQGATQLLPVLMDAILKAVGKP